jgi:hypothetical protein
MAKAALMVAIIIISRVESVPVVVVRFAKDSWR